ncbi:MAG: hypothetical protein HQ548_06260 [Chloroflexi bacterium]|nr:hypothetical protein [Chloroflexota bacterium]
MAIAIEVYQRIRVRGESRKQDDGIRKAALGTLYFEVWLNCAWANSFMEVGEKAAQTQTPTKQLMHRPSDSAWKSAQRDLPRLGLPGEAYISLYLAYHNLAAVTFWADSIYEWTGRAPDEVTVFRQSESRKIATIAVKRHAEAIRELQQWAKQLNVDLEESAGFKSYAKAMGLKSGTAATAEQ